MTLTWTGDDGWIVNRVKKRLCTYYTTVPFVTGAVIGTWPANPQNDTSLRVFHYAFDDPEIIINRDM